jgi:hypothetical protein
MWHQVGQYISGLFHKASPRALVLVLPHIPWGQVTNRDDLIQRWAAAAFAIPYTEEVAQSVVVTLFQIASEEELLPYIPINIWSWLTKQPPLPPVCLGRHVGTRAHVVKAVRALNDIEVLKSYFLLIWSEWNVWGYGYRSGFSDMRISIQEDFGGIGMRHHRADLVRHLNHVLRQLDRGLEYLKQHNPEFNEVHLEGMKDQYQNLRGMLLGAIGCTSPSTITPLRMLMLDYSVLAFAFVDTYPTVCSYLFRRISLPCDHPHFFSLALSLFAEEAFWPRYAGIQQLTPALGERRILQSIYVRAPSPMSVVSQLEHSVLPLPTSFIPLRRYHPPDLFPLTVSQFSYVLLGYALFGPPKTGGPQGWSSRVHRHCHIPPAIYPHIPCRRTVCWVSMCLCSVLLLIQLLAEPYICFELLFEYFVVPVRDKSRTRGTGQINIFEAGVVYKSFLNW